MATDTSNLNSRSASQTKLAMLSPTDWAAAILSPLASLKLTVVLLVLAVLLTFIATLDQTRDDVFNVKMKHFESVFVAVPFQTFFVPNWAPDQQDIPGSFYLPSGLTVLVLMLLNLTAAHVLRFKLQAKGGKLVVGLVVAVFAVLLTWAVIFNGQGADGFQSEPPISWETMWLLMQIGLLALAVGASVALYLLERGRAIERVLLGLAILISGATLTATLVYGERMFIGASAMRILWQLIQSTMAALVAYLACMILFRRKAGIVLLHLGVAGLLLNEIYVTTTNEEQRMTVFEGETSSVSIDIRATELAIIDTSDPEIDQIVTVPGEQLRGGKLVTDADLPFNVQCIQYFQNSDIAERKTGDPPSLATDGIGLMSKVIELPPTAGTDSEQVADFASAYVVLTDKETGDSLGTYLVSQSFKESAADSVTVGEQEYRILLRFKTAYKPYALELVNATRENYLGTDTPRNYASDVVLNDFTRGITSDQKIWMNNPLRYSGETFYQSGMDDVNGREYSVFQVVKNNGWMIPYVCCMFSVVGLLAQFGSSLMGFMEKARKEEENAGNTIPQNDTPEAATPGEAILPTGNKQKAWKQVWIPAIVIVGIFGLWTAGKFAKARTGTVVKDGLRLDLLGQVPVTTGGRVQPLDSYARNLARQLSKREELIIANRERSILGFKYSADVKRPAIEWLADTLFEAEGFEDYRAFRIEDLNVLGQLDLPATFPGARGNFRYTLDELLQAEPKMRSLIPRNKNPKEYSQLETRIAAVMGMLQKVYGLKLSFGSSQRDEANVLLQLENAADPFESPVIPLVVPTQDSEEPWLRMQVAQARQLLTKLSQRFEANTTQTLARAIVDQEVLPKMRRQMIVDNAVRLLLEVPEFVELMAKQSKDDDPAVIAELLRRRWETIPEQVKAPILKQVTPIVEAELLADTPRYQNVVESMLVRINGDSAGEIKPFESEAVALLQQIGPAYRAGDAETFNANVSAYLKLVDEMQPAGYSKFKVATEGYYNWLSPFYIAMVLYLIAMVIGMFGWIGFNRTFNSAATGVMTLALLVHIFGLVERVIISGRPPVTNLYSSVLFVSAVMVVLMLIVERITKLGIGTLVASLGSFAALLWAWSMTIADGDTFTVMQAVLDTQFWLATHVVCISIGYAATFGAGLLGAAYLVATLVTPVISDKGTRRKLINVIYGIACFGLLASFFGTVLGGLWGDDSWGRFWGWDPKENGALMIVLWNALILHSRWGGLVRERGIAMLAVLGNIIVLWSWKGVNALGVGLHAYGGSEDPVVYKILYFGLAHLVIAALILIPERFYMSYASGANQKAMLK